MLSLTSGYASNWPQFQGDEFNSGLTQYAIPSEPKVLWTTDLKRIDVPPIIFGEAVYVLADNGTLWSLNKKTGQKNWKAQMDGWVFQTSTPACNGDKVIAATDSGYLAAFDVSTGQNLWTSHLSNKRFECPLTYVDGNVYVGEGSAYGKKLKKYFCFSEEGTELWNASRESHGYMWCGACKAGNFLIYGDNDGILFSINRDSGNIVDLLNLSDSSRINFARSDRGRIRNSVSYQGGHLYTASESSANSGYVWKVGFDKLNGSFLNEGWSSSMGFSTSTPVVYEGRVYVGLGEHGYPGAMACLDDATGEPVWTYPVEAGVKSSPVISTAGDRPRICFTAAKVNGSVHCIEDVGFEARPIWNFNPPDQGYILAGVAVSDDCVYFGTEDGHLYCLFDSKGIELAAESNSAD